MVPNVVLLIYSCVHPYFVRSFISFMSLFSHLPITPFYPQFEKDEVQFEKAEVQFEITEIHFEKHETQIEKDKV